MSNPSSPRRTGRPPGAVRVLAAVVGMMLVFASVAPPFALAETDSEGEGSAPPGALPGLEEGEPGGGETLLEEAPPAPGEGEAEEVPPTLEVGGTPTVPSPESTVTSVEEPAPAPEVAQPAAPAPAPAPVYGTEESPPSYQPAPQPAVPPVVRNDAIAAPEVQRSEAPPPAPAAPMATPVGEGAASLPEPVEVPEPVVSQAAPPPATAEPAANLKGRRSYTAAPGDCLWSIATALLRPGASSAEIEAEIARLWRMNAARIGTGDPNLLLVGTVLRLR
ncbi:MAG TPA: hypothetical protein VHZ54_14255 [Solirubrobacterales bacterium]|nr:hypothetical protein [Solirubrobacterales bacterium]